MTHILSLPQELSIYTAGEIRADWLTWLGDLPDDVEIDGSAVEQVDGAGIQLLLALRHALKQRGRPWQLRAASATLTAACSALGTLAVLQGALKQAEAA